MSKMISRLLAFTLAFVVAGPASAYIRISRLGPNGVVQAHWLDSELPLEAIIDARNADITEAQALAVVQASAETWEAVPTAYFTVNPTQYSGAAGEVAPALANDGQNSVLFEQTGENFPTVGVIAFVRSFVNVNDGHTVDADLVFNDRDYYSSISNTGVTPAPPSPPGSPAQTAVDLQSVLAHEFGHFFGLDHTSVSGATMVPFISNTLAQRTLELDDQAGLSAIFPTPEFLATTGTIKGTVLSGYTGAAIFGAHVEAYRLPSLAFATGISAISGELTMRNGSGDFEIKGLPPGDYWVRIVPLDGVSTTAADANIGGVYNGLDTNFEVEFWNGAGESGLGFTDPPNATPTPVTVTAGATAGGINFITNAYPGRVNIDPYGAFESTVTFANNAYLAVRFDLPFTPPYRIQSVRFPSFTFNAQLGLPAAPAVFPSVTLRRMNPATGLPDFAAAPLFSRAPFSGSANGNNTVSVDLDITTPDETLFWVMQFPTFTGALPNFPFVRMDFSLHDRGYFGASYTVAASGQTGALLVDRNLAVGMTVLTDPEQAPIEAPHALVGMNRRDDQAEFTYVPPADLRADGFPLAQNSLAYTNLVSRALAVYGVLTTGGAGTPVIKLQPNPGTAQTIWAVQAVDKSARRSLLSNVTMSGVLEDADEPNGRTNEATPLALPVASRAETYWPAGDQDYYSFTARVGDVITATAVAATPTAAQAGNDLDLVMVLLDGSGNIVAFNDDSSATTLNPRIQYTVTGPSANSNKAQERFTLLVMDFYGSPFSPESPGRVVVPAGYSLNVATAPPAPPAP